MEKKNKDKFKIEVIEFYPFENKNGKSTVLGTMHIYIPNIDLDVRGVMVIKMNKGIVFYMPHKIDWDDALQKKIRYPIISFANKKTMQHLIASLRYEGLKFLKEKGIQ